MPRAPKAQASSRSDYIITGFLFVKSLLTDFNVKTFQTWNIMWRTCLDKMETLTWQFWICLHQSPQHIPGPWIKCECWSVQKTVKAGKVLFLSLKVLFNFHFPAVTLGYFSPSNIWALGFSKPNVLEFFLSNRFNRWWHFKTRIMFHFLYLL